MFPNVENGKRPDAGGRNFTDILKALTPGFDRRIEPDLNCGLRISMSCGFLEQRALADDFHCHLMLAASRFASYVKSILPAPAI